MLDPQRQQHLLDLAGVGLVEGQEALAGELLGQGAAALRQATLAQVGERRAGDAHDVDAAVAAEPLILDGEQRLDQVRRDIGQRHVEAAFVEDGERRGVGGVVEDGGLGHLAHPPHVLDARQADEQLMDAPLRAGDGRRLRQRHQGRDDGTGTREPAHRAAQRRSEAANRRAFEHGCEHHTCLRARPTRPAGRWGLGGSISLRYYDLGARGWGLGAGV